MPDLPHPKHWRYRRLLTEHVFDKLWQLDLSLAEFRILLDGESLVIEARAAPGGLREVVLLVEWTRPLHVVVIVDETHEEERLITVYEPSADQWTTDFRTRR